MPENNQRKNPFLLAPALTLPILLCFGIASLVFSKPLQNTNAYIVAAVLWIVIFGAPTGLFFWMRGGKWLSSCLKPVSARSIALSVSASLLLMIHASFVHSLTLEGFFDHHVYTLYGVPFWIEADSPASLFGAFVSLALIPALMEGLFYRGILMYEYRYGGVFLSSCLSSVLYALTGAELVSFPLLFLNGVFLSMTAFLTGNIFCSVLAHVGYLLFLMLGEKYVLFLAVEEETRIILLFFLIWLWITVAVFFFDTAENVLRKRGEKEHAKPICLPKRNRAVVFYDIISAPMLWADIFCFGIFSLLHLLL